MDNKELKERFFKMKPIDYFEVKSTGPRVVYHHGEFWDSCEICDAEINDDNPGKEIHYDDKNGVHHVTAVCNSCFIDPDYLSCYVDKQNLRIVFLSI